MIQSKKEEQKWIKLDSGSRGIELQEVKEEKAGGWDSTRLNLINCARPQH